MKQPIDMGFAERRKASTEAKLKLLKKLEPAIKADTPEAQAKRAERAALGAAREDRRAERERERREKAEREKVEAAARAEAEAAEKAAAEAAEADRLIALQAAQKAERDRRYAARKQRKR